MAPDEPLSSEQVTGQVQYWLDLADYDLETGRAMLASGRLLYVAFMCHQTVEKALKALYADRRRATPPRIHGLVALAQKAGAHAEMSPAQQDCLEALDPMNIECRYPAEKGKLLAALTPASCGTMLAETEELLAWLRQKLSST